VTTSSGVAFVSINWPELPANRWFRRIDVSLAATADQGVHESAVAVTGEMEQDSILFDVQADRLLTVRTRGAQVVRGDGVQGCSSDDADCLFRFRMQSVAAGEPRCFEVDLPGPSNRYQVDRANSLRCGMLRGSGSFLCHAERVQRGLTMVAFDHLAFTCSFDRAGLRCGGVPTEGQPSLRRFAAQAYAGDQLFVWSGRHSQIVPPSRRLGAPDCITSHDLTTGNEHPTMCGMPRNGSLLRDGAIYTHRAEPERLMAQGTPCTDHVFDADGNFIRFGP
jgi:hypothetical protein